MLSNYSVIPPTHFLSFVHSTRRAFTLRVDQFLFVVGDLVLLLDECCHLSFSVIYRPYQILDLLR